MNFSFSCDICLLYYCLIYLWNQVLRSDTMILLVSVWSFMSNSVCVMELVFDTYTLTIVVSFCWLVPITKRIRLLFVRAFWVLVHGILFSIFWILIWIYFGLDVSLECCKLSCFIFWSSLPIWAFSLGIEAIYIITEKY